MTLSIFLIYFCYYYTEGSRTITMNVRGGDDLVSKVMGEYDANTWNH